MSHHKETRELPGERDNARNNARCMQAISRCGQDSPRKSQTEWQRTEINGESTFMIKDGSRTEQNKIIGMFLTIITSGYDLTNCL